MGQGQGQGGQGGGQGQGQGQGMGVGQGQGQGTGVGVAIGMGGTGGKGQGRGGLPPEEAHETDQVPDLVRGKLQKGGRIVTHGYIRGVPPKGEARRKYMEIVAENKDSFDNPAELEKIPREHRDTVREYFESVGAKEADGEED